MPARVLTCAAVQESRERVRAAIKNSGCVFPIRRVTVNLAPADLEKEGPANDLPIALAVVMASQPVPDGHSQALYLGELSLDGTSATPTAFCRWSALRATKA